MSDPKTILEKTPHSLKVFKSAVLANVPLTVFHIQDLAAWLMAFHWLVQENKKIICHELSPSWAPSVWLHPFLS